MGVIYVQITTEDGVTPFSGACLLLNGPVSISICDNGLGDVDLSDGVIEIESVPVGTYEVLVAPVEGFELIAPLEPLQVEQDTVAQIAIAFRAISGPTSVPSAETERFGVLLLQFVLEDGVTPVTPVCLSLNGASAFQVCDNEDPDVEPTDGVIELDSVPVGDYSAIPTGLEGLELVGDQPNFTIEEGVVTSLTLTFRPIATVEPTVETPAFGVLVVQSTLEDGVTFVPGVCLSLTGPSPLDICDNDGTDVDSSDGAIEFDFLSPGDYSVEISAPEGFELVEGVSDVTIEADLVAPIAVTLRSLTEVATEVPTQEPTVEVTEAPVTLVGTLVIQTVDAGDGTTVLSGACFDVTGPDGTVFNVCDVDELGEIRLDGLAVGSWTVQMTTAPEGYELPEAQGGEVTENGETVLVFAVAPRQEATGNLSVSTVDADGNLLVGGCFSLRSAAGEVVELCDDDNDGFVTFEGVTAGEWTVAQISVQEGFALAENPEQVVTVEPESTVEVVFTSVATAAEGNGFPPVIVEPEQVSIISDFQDELGCSTDLEAECEVTRLSKNGELWNTYLAVPPGFYSLRFLVRSDSDVTLGDKGLIEGAEIPLIVAPGSDLVYFEYDTLSGALRVLPVRHQIQIATNAGVFNFKPVEDDLFAVTYPALAGEEPFQILVDGQIVAEGTTTLETDQRVRLLADMQGNFESYEAVPLTTLTVVRSDAEGNPIAGSCFGLFDKDDQLVAQRCDVEGTGATRIEFPDGIKPGTYVIRETLTPPGFEPASDSEIDLVEGDNSFEASS